MILCPPFAPRPDLLRYYVICATMLKLLRNICSDIMGVAVLESHHSLLSLLLSCDLILEKLVIEEEILFLTEGKVIILHGKIW